VRGRRYPGFDGFSSSGFWILYFLTPKAFGAEFSRSRFFSLVLLFLTTDANTVTHHPSKSSFDRQKTRPDLCQSTLNQFASTQLSRVRSAASSPHVLLTVFNLEEIVTQSPS